MRVPIKQSLRIGNDEDSF